MSESASVGGRPIDRTAQHRSGPRLTAAVLAVSTGWLLLALVAMLLPTSPDVGPVSGTAQHLLLGLALSIMVAAALARATRLRPAGVAWAAVAATSAALLAYELLQLAVPVRAFQWVDLTNGIAGVTIGGLVALAGLQFGERFIAVVTGFGAVALLFGAVGLAVLPDDDLRQPIDARLSQCAEATGAQNAGVAPGSTTDWRNQPISLAITNPDCVVSGPALLVPFGAPVSDASNSDPSEADHDEADHDEADQHPADQHGAEFDGGGLVSAPLVGLPEALGRSNAITFGIRFNSAIDDKDTTPAVLARLSIDVDPARPIISVLQRGPHLTINVGSGRPVIGLGLPLADQVRPGADQSLVVTYAAGVVTAYLDGEPVGESAVAPFPFTIEEDLRLEIGWRADERWSPFRGTISELLIADRAFTPSEVATAFQP